MKAAIRTLNNGFVALILVGFYFVVIGLTRVMYELFRLGEKKLTGSSYWERLPEVIYNEEHFSSPY